MAFRNKNKLTIFIFAAILGLVTLPNPGKADDASIQQQIDQKQQQLQQLTQQEKSLQAQVLTKQKQSATLSNEISLYNIQIQETSVKLLATQTNIQNTQLLIDQTKSQIDQKNQQITEEKNLLGQLLTEIDQYQNASGLQVTLGSANFSDFMDQLQYTQSLQDRVFSLLQQIKDLKTKLESDQANLQQNLDQLNKLNVQLTSTEKTLNDQKSSKATLLVETKGQESRYKKLLSSTQDEEAKIDQEIYQLDQQVQNKTGVTRLKPIHGILAWPMDGVITQGYGNTGFSKLGYEFHNGIDIAAAPGTNINAAADGVVVATGTGQAAYGNWVAIKHTITAAGGHQIITLYAHMRSFIVSAGQQVKIGDLIGYEGNTGNTTRLLYGPEHGYHLHFGVFDAQDFSIKVGAYPGVYGPYQIPYGYTYDPMEFL